MNLFKRLINKLKFNKQEDEILELNVKENSSCSNIVPSVEPQEDIKQEKPQTIKIIPKVKLNTGNVEKIYPEGLPRKVLEFLDYKRFGTILKQENLLPQSYERKPAKVEIGDFAGTPRVILTFKSKNNESVRCVGIYKYKVSYTEKTDTLIKTMEVNPAMMVVWKKFAERVMWAWERGYINEYMDLERKGNIGKNLMAEDYAYIESLKEIAKWNKKAEENNMD